MKMKRMNKLKYLIVFLILGISSCVREVDDLFDQSAAERLNTAMNEHREVLISAPNGWHMEYYAGVEDEKVGGINYIFLFEEGGEVIGACEYFPGEEITSHYDVVGDQGPVLTFNTYNEILHYFTEPWGASNIDGDMGDYEFVIMEATPQQITLKGKRHGNRIIMTPFAKPRSEWQSYLGEISTLREETEICSILTFFKDGKQIGAGVYDGGYRMELDDVKIVNFAIQTTKGLKFYEPFVFGDKEAVNFEWDATSSTYSCTDGIDFKIVCDVPETYAKYNEYIGTYTFKYNRTLSQTVTVTEKVKDKTLRVSGNFPFDFELTYVRITGRVALMFQEVGTNGNNIVCITPWDPIEGYLTWDTSVGYEAILDKTEGKFDLKFVDNGVWGSYVVDGFLFYQFTSSGTTAGSYPGGNSQFYFVSMEKQ